jgi:hypothetical protein
MHDGGGSSGGLHDGGHHGGGGLQHHHHHHHHHQYTGVSQGADSGALLSTLRGRGSQGAGHGGPSRPVQGLSIAAVTALVILIAAVGVVVSVTTR